MIAGHNADPLYPIFNLGLVSVNHLEKILKKIMHDKTLALMLVFPPIPMLTILQHVLTHCLPILSSLLPPFPLITLSLHLITH
jgi:hypothetical protein